MEKITSQNRWKSRKVKLSVIRAQPLPPEEESALWENSQMGDFNGKVLTNKNLKNLTEQLGLRGRQEHTTTRM